MSLVSQPCAPSDGRTLRIGVIVFPGSNCDRDAASAWSELGLGDAKLLWHQDTDLDGIDAVIVPGGFSYGDALRAGAIARFSPIMGAVAEFAARGGLVAGICNGFQILCEAGLLPGALTRNDGMRFVCKPVHLRVENAESAFTAQYAPGSVLEVPIAHGEGRFVCDDETLAALTAENKILFRYCEPDGRITGDSNPNGSRDNIAGILGGPRNNVLGMMPHPERAIAQRLGSADGVDLFLSLHRYLAGREGEPVSRTTFATASAAATNSTLATAG